jgi:hypothetical protein
MESADIVAACNRAGLQAVGVDGIFDGRRPHASRAGCPPD